jgi:hypothetical protein
MFAGACPDGFDDDAENVGRALADVVMFAGVVVLLVWTSGEVVDEGSANADSEAFLRAFLAFEMLVFGLGGAVPRMWFALKSVPAPAKPPELLVQAGKRAGVFCYCAFVSVGIALSAARLVAGTRGLPRPRHHVKPPPPPPEVRKVVVGSLCQPEREGCKSQDDVSVFVRDPGQFRVRFSSHDQLPPCIATGLHGHGDWIDDLASGQPAMFDVEEGEVVSVTLGLEEEVPQCGYRVELEEVMP